MRIFPNLPQSVDKIPISKGPGLRTKNGCDGPDKQTRDKQSKRV